MKTAPLPHQAEEQEKHGLPGSGAISPNSGTLKKCTKCGRLLPIADFGPNVQCAEGKDTRCRSCVATYNREYRRLHPDKIREQYIRHRDRLSPEKRLRRSRLSHEKFRDRERQQTRKYLRDHPGSARKSHYVREYGITEEEYRVMFQQQLGMCAWCHHPETTRRQGKIINLAVDHDHSTGKIRGLLCRKCNIALAGHEWLLDVGSMPVSDYLRRGTIE